MSSTKTSKIVIGNTSKRNLAGGRPWIGQGQVLASFEEAIPASFIRDNLLNWEPIEVPNANLIPCDVSEADYILPDGTPARVSIREGAVGIVRSDDGSPLGQFKEGFNSASYGRMLNFTQEALQGHLPFLNAGELRNGAQFFATVALDKTMHDDKSGLDFLPYLMFHSSLDGSLANTWIPGTLLPICDNQFAGMRTTARNAGRLVKFKRSRFSLTDQKVRDLRSALGVLQLEADAMSAMVGELVDIELTRRDWIKVLDIIIPQADNEASKAAQTKSENRRNTVDALYQNSPMVSQWTGTAFGAVQAFNTYAHHEQSVRGSSRVERVFDRVIRGDMAASDGATIAALETVLGRELVNA